MKRKVEKYFLVLICLASIVVFLFLYINLLGTVDDVARSVLDEKVKQTRTELKSFFSPVKEGLKIEQKRGEMGLFEDISLEGFNQYFIPFVEKSSVVSSLMLADEKGSEFMLLHTDTLIINRETKVISDSIESKRYEWVKDEEGLRLLNTVPDRKNYDPRNRPWYVSTVENDAAEIQWTPPYTFFTTADPGITASVKWKGSENITKVLAYDLMLTDISSFTTNFEVTKNGKIFIITDDYRILGLPKSDKYMNKDDLKANVLKNIDSLGLEELSISHKEWDENEHQEDYFNFEYGDENWWCVIKTYQLGNQKFYIGVIAPEKDFLAQIQRTKWMIIIGMIVVLLFIMILSQAYRKKELINQELNAKNNLINAKNEEIMDSIKYAERIQSAILPSDQFIKECFPESFVLFKPKDVVSGDFYWLEQHNGQTFIAAADCTGHGVPGAMVSVVCSNALSKSLLEENITEPDQILNRTRELIIQRFGKSGEDVKDGMDISLVSLAHRVRAESESESSKPSEGSQPSEGLKLSYAGANNPLWIIRTCAEQSRSKDTTEVEEIKADKQPVGKFVHGKAFTKHELSVSKGDMIYMFSDGFADQFGGDKNKKFKSGHLKKLLLSIREKSMEQQKQILDETFESWRGEYEQIDDICMIGIKF